MKKALTRGGKLYYYKDGEKVKGPHSEIRGEVSGLSGNVSRLKGYVSEIRGDVDACELTEEERSHGIQVNDLVGR